MRMKIIKTKGFHGIVYGIYVYDDNNSKSIMSSFRFNEFKKFIFYHLSFHRRQEKKIA